MDWPHQPNGITSACALSRELKMTEDSASDSAIANPEIKLEDVRGVPGANTCEGRGRETASGRGYNAERLATGIFSESGVIYRGEVKPYIDRVTLPRPRPSFDIEVKSCVDRYQSSSNEVGRYGQFRIWKSHHDQLTRENKETDRATSVYLFVVYSVVDGVEQEVGKLVVTAQRVDEILDDWTVERHVTMGEQKNRRISWHLLLKRLNVPIDRFKDELVIDLTDE